MGWRLLIDMSPFCPTDTHTVLLVSADAARTSFLADQLTADGFSVVSADDASMGRRALERSFPDAVIVDARLPDAHGLHVVAAIRDAEQLQSRVDTGTPAIVLVDGAAPIERIRALDRGADDALALPMDYAELVARLRAVLRRSEARGRRGLLRVGPLHLDPISRDVRLGDQPLDLSQKEFLLLQVLAGDPTRVFSKEELLRSVWGMRSGGGRTRTLDSHACRLRRKLSVGGGRFVINVWGVGYRLLDGPIDQSGSDAGLAVLPGSALAVAA